uniref:WW domain-containing protein n=1 Tax=Rhabditophanes sp. KR3021 TaxID=114890 RepID=A0AC35UHI0_9BILA
MVPNAGFVPNNNQPRPYPDSSILSRANVDNEARQKEIFSDMMKVKLGYKEGDEIWVEVVQPDGKSYYFHAFTKNAVWIKPEGNNVKIIQNEIFVKCGMEASKNRDELNVAERKAAAQFKDLNAHPQRQMTGIPQNASNGIQLDPALFWQEHFDQNTERYYYFNVQSKETTWVKPKALIDKDNQARLLAEEEKKNEIARKKTNRAIKTIPVKGTQWSVVWTGDGKIFFHNPSNPSTCQSVWDRPPELFHREDVDAMLRISSDDVTEEPVVTDQSAEKIDHERKDEPVAKRAKMSDSNILNIHSKLISDPTVQKEIEAQKTRELVPYNERACIFKQLMLEKNVSAFSIWEKELTKIIDDERYLLLNKDERKSEYDTFVKERMITEREEKKKKLQIAKKNFHSLLAEAELTSKSLFSSFAAKFCKDERYKKIEKSREREDMFNAFIKNLYQKEKDLKKQGKHDASESFVQLLKTLTSLTKYSRWSSVKRQIDKDERYKNPFLNSELREELFVSHIKKLGSMSKSDEEEESKRKDRLKNKSAAEIALDERRKIVEEEKEATSKNIRHTIESSGRSHCKNIFQTILLEKIKIFDMSWHDAKKILRDDKRYEECDLLSRSDKEKAFEDHLKKLIHERQLQIFELFDQESEINFCSKWRDAEKVLALNPIYKQLYTSDRKLEKDYREWKSVKKDKALGEFKTLLKETKIITHRSKKMNDENPQHLVEVLKILEKDNRYLALNIIPDKRDRVFEDFLEKLERDGPPPVVTCSKDFDKHKKK